MGEKYGIEEFSLVVEFAAKAVIAEQEIENKDGVIPVLFELAPEVAKLSNFSFSKLKLEADDLSVDEVNQLRDQFKEQAQIQNKDLQAKIDSCTDFVSRVVVYAEQIFNFVQVQGMKFYEDGMQLIKDGKELFSNVNAVPNQRLKAPKK